MNVRLKQVIKLAVVIILCLATGSAGALFTRSAVPEWYAGLEKPSFTPPDRIFGIVWPVLYIMMGTAAFLVWQQGVKSKAVKTALILFVLQLIFNGLWTPIFFGMHAILPALIEIIILWLVILATIVAFWRLSRPASFLLIPYILWVSFAVILNLSFCLLNK